MVRTYKRKTTRGQYGEETLKAALRLINEGRSLKSVSKELGVPAKTLRRHRDGKVKTPGTIVLGPKTTVLPAELEAELRDYIFLMEKRMYSLTPNEVRRLAFHLAERSGVPHNFSKTTQMAGRDWLSNFLVRNKALAVRIPIATSFSRIEGFNKESVDLFFEKYKTVLGQLKFDETMLHRLWNIDETGVTTVTAQVKVLCTKGARQVRKASSGERGKNVTALCSMNAAGGYGVPPFFVFPRKRMNPLLMADAPTGSVGHCNERGTGYMDRNLFLIWQQHFAHYTSCSKEAQHVVVLDGHESHKTLDAIDFCRDNGIILISLPPHSSHKMQPLDRTFFKSLKSNYRQEVERWMMNHRGQRVTQFDVAGIFAAAYHKSATIEKAKKGFEVSGIWPYNNNKFDEDFVDLTEQEAGAQPPPIPNDIVINPNVLMNDAQNGSTSPNPAQKSSSSSNVQGPSNTAHVAVSSSTQAVADIHQVISPPRVSGNVNQKRKTTKKQQSEILTSSPYKETLLLRKENKGKGKGKRKPKSQGGNPAKKTAKKPNQKEKEKEKANTSEPVASCSGEHTGRSRSKKDWSCIVCGENWSNSRPGERWVKCVDCGDWAHEDCTPGHGIYVCDLCEKD